MPYFSIILTSFVLSDTSFSVSGTNKQLNQIKFYKQSKDKKTHLCISRPERISRF